MSEILETVQAPSKFDKRQGCEKALGRSKFVGMNFPSANLPYDGIRLSVDTVMVEPSTFQAVWDGSAKRYARTCKNTRLRQEAQELTDDSESEDEDDSDDEAGSEDEDSVSSDDDDQSSSASSSTEEEDTEADCLTVIHCLLDVVQTFAGATGDNLVHSKFGTCIWYKSSGRAIHQLRGSWPHW